MNNIKSVLTKLTFYDIYKIGYSTSTVFMSYSTYKHNDFSLFKDLMGLKKNNPYTTYLMAFYSSMFFSLAWPVLLPFSITIHLDRNYQDKLENESKPEKESNLEK